MGEFIYNLLNSKVFQIIVIIWFIILVIWKDKWSAVLTRSINIVKKPLIFKKDPNLDNVPTYPREFLEDSAISFRNALTQPLVSTIKVLHTWLGNLVKTFYDPKHPFRTIGYILLLGFFLLLVYSDAVAIANTLYVLQLSTQIPPLLANFDIAVFAGSLIALILGFAFLFESSSTNSEFTSMSDREPKIRRAYLALAVLVSLLAVVSLAAWGLARFAKIENANNTSLDQFVQFVMVFVVPLNSALVAAMIFNEAIRGLVTVIAGLGYTIEGILYAINHILNLLGSLLPYLFDIFYRITHIVIDILIWIITTPIFALFWPFQKAYELIAGPESGEETTNKTTPTK